jgi:hypothetical protein
VTRRRLAFIAAALVAVLALAIRCITRDRPRPRIVSTRTTTRLDLGAFRSQLAVRRAAAEELRRRVAARAHSAETTWPRTRPAEHLLFPTCQVGPADLCASLADAATACDDGDGASCLAIAQYLDDVPPHNLTLAIYKLACDKGEQAGCDRMARIMALPAEPTQPCADDLLACQWQAMKAHDPVRFDEACSLGVADACALMLDFVDDPERQRDYLERACQLGNTFACMDVSYRLTPECEEGCYPPDPVASSLAAEIACEAGHAIACEHVIR